VEVGSQGGEGEPAARRGGSPSPRSRKGNRLVGTASPSRHIVDAPSFLRRSSCLL
jgi:hypothetical protein